MISEGSGYSPSIAAENGEVHVVWQDRFFPSNDIYYKHFDGSTWHPKVELGVEAPCGGRQIDADIAAEGDKVHVTWVEMRGWENDICYAYFNANEWLPPQEISTDSGGEEQHRPAIAVEGGLAYVVWEDEGGGDYDIVLRKGVEDFTQPVSSLDPTGGYWKTTDTYDIGWWANDDFGLAKVSLFYKFSADNTVWSSWSEYGFDDTVSGTSASGTFSFTAPDGDGHYEFYSIATDTSGNEDDPPLVADMTAGVDTTPPTGSVIVNNGDEWTSSTSVTLTLDYQDNTSGVGQIRFRNDDTWDTEPWESSVQTTTWVLESGEGTKTVHYQIRDIAGLESMTYSDEVSLDATPPTGTISINDGDELTNSISVSLKLTYSDSLSGVSQIRFSNDDVWDAVPWESPSLTRAWTLSTGQGTKTVHYRVIDDAGLESVSFSDEIELDQTPPLIESIAPAHGATGIEITETVTVTFTEMISRPVETGSIVLRTNGTELDFTIEWSADNRTAILHPTMNLN
ncbi:MAG: Ig-like domain-containing protein, partial [Thermoplasmata archaeon]|nr:Ig-like domain-containing protein [Thermoplasmata archaeon]